MCKCIKYTFKCQNGTLYIYTYVLVLELIE